MTEQNLFTGVIEDRFKLLRPLGSGGFGVVMEASDLVFNRDVAIKFLKIADGTDPDVLARFQREAKIMAQLEHENVVAVYSYGVYQTYPYMVMERAAGVRLRELIISDGIEDFAMFRSIIVQVCRGLDYAHKHGVVHRDLSPANICVAVQGDEVSVKVIDFGLAHVLEGSGTAEGKLTRTGSVVGNIAYMSPEQCSGKSVDARSDIYSLGCIMYECVSGNVPLPLDSQEIALDRSFQRILAWMPDSPSIRPQLAERTVLLREVVLRCLQKSPSDRFDNCSEIIECLESLQRPGTGPSTWSTRATASSKKSPVTLVATVVAVVFLVFGWALYGDAALVRAISASNGWLFQKLHGPTQLRLAETLTHFNYPQSSALCYKLIATDEKIPGFSRILAWNTLARRSLEIGNINAAAAEMQESIKLQRKSKAASLSKQMQELAERCVNQLAASPICTGVEVYLRDALLEDAARARTPAWSKFFRSLQDRTSEDTMKFLTAQDVVLLSECYRRALSQLLSLPDEYCIARSKKVVRELMHRALCNEAAALVTTFDRWPAAALSMAQQRDQLLAQYNSLSEVSLRALVSKYPQPSAALRNSQEPWLALINVAMGAALSSDSKNARYFANEAVRALRPFTGDGESSKNLRLEMDGLLGALASAQMYLVNKKASLSQWLAFDEAMQTIEASWNGKHRMCMVELRYVSLKETHGIVEARKYLSTECKSWKSELLDIDEELANSPGSLRAFAFVTVGCLDSLPKADRLDFLRTGMKILTLDSEHRNVEARALCVLLASALGAERLARQNYDELLREVSATTDLSQTLTVVRAIKTHAGLHAMLTQNDKDRLKQVVEEVVRRQAAPDPAKLKEIRSLVSSL